MIVVRVKAASLVALCLVAALSSPGFAQSPDTVFLEEPATAATFSPSSITRRTISARLHSVVRAF